MRIFYWTTSVLLALFVCSSTPVYLETDKAVLAEQFFRGVYGGDTSVVGDLAGEEIVISYPIFEKLFNKPGINGHDAVRAFITRFSKKWGDAEVTIHESIAEDDKVVLIWSFKARDIASDTENAWGGISLFRFDEAGKIVAEMGLESTPGPVERFDLVGTVK